MHLCLRIQIVITFVQIIIIIIIIITNTIIIKKIKKFIVKKEKRIIVNIDIDNESEAWVSRATGAKVFKI